MLLRLGTYKSKEQEAHHRCHIGLAHQGRGRHEQYARYKRKFGLHRQKHLLAQYADKILTPKETRPDSFAGNAHPPKS
jgi:hypothetical protein